MVAERQATPITRCCEPWRRTPASATRNEPGVNKNHLKNDRVEQSNFDSYQILRMDEAPAIDVHIAISQRLVGRARPRPQAAWRDRWYWLRRVPLAAPVLRSQLRGPVSRISLHGFIIVRTTTFNHN